VFIAGVPRAHRGWSQAMRLDGLDDFSAGFANQLFAIYPAWASSAKVETPSGADFGYLLVEVPPPPQADFAYPLTIYTRDGEVTVVFDYYHTQFFPQPAIPLNTDALDFIARILREDISTGSGWDKDLWLGAWVVEENEDPKVENPMGSMRRIRVRSWNGSRNLDFINS
jgi:hypothetical protein